MTDPSGTGAVSFIDLIFVWWTRRFTFGRERIYLMDLPFIKNVYEKCVKKSLVILRNEGNPTSKEYLLVQNSHLGLRVFENLPAYRNWINMLDYRKCYIVGFVSVGSCFFHFFFGKWHNDLTNLTFWDEPETQKIQVWIINIHVNDKISSRCLLH